MSDPKDTDPLDREIDFSGGKRGPVIPPDRGKQRITIRLDRRVIDYFRSQVIEAGGGSYQTLINQALLEHIERQEQGERYKEEALKRVLEEVLAARKDAA
jgi:uncharacterized protein (DUF4415 family)